MNWPQEFRCSPDGIHQKENALIVDEIIIIFTKKEYKVVRALIGDVIVDDQTLIDLLFEAQKMDKQLQITSKRHIANVQGKLRPSGLYIHRVSWIRVFSLGKKREANGDMSRASNVPKSDKMTPTCCRHFIE